MGHALIIDDNMVVSNAIQSYLEPLGFATFDQTWTEAQAIAAAEMRPPDLIVIGDELEAGSSLRAAQRITEWLAVPVLMVTGDSARARRRFDTTCRVDGPFLLNQIEEVVNIVQDRSRRFCGPVADVCEA